MYNGWIKDRQTQVGHQEAQGKIELKLTNASTLPHSDGSNDSCVRLASMIQSSHLIKAGLTFATSSLLDYACCQPFPSDGSQMCSSAMSGTVGIV